MWCIPIVSSEFVARMEDVLGLYEQAYQAEEPVICLDERPVQLLAHKRDPQPAVLHHPRRWDYEYERRGSANLFLLFQPLNAWRLVKATAQRKKADFAAVLRQLVDVHYGGD